MKLLLVQHGQAMDKQTDPRRPLSGQGRLEVSEMANYFRQSDLQIAHIYHSGKPRAAQTAGIFSDVLNVAHVALMDGINPTDPVEPIAEAIKQWTENTIIISHMPFLAHLVSYLLTRSISSASDHLLGNIVSLESNANKYGHWPPVAPMVVLDTR